MGSKLHQQAVALANANASGLAARQSAISAAHPKLGQSQIANRALRQVTRLELGYLRHPSSNQLQDNLAPAIAPDAGTISNGSAGGGGVGADYGGGLITASTDPTASTTATGSGSGFWGSLSTTGKVTIIAGGLLIGFILYRKFGG